jgi:hypothetical protein
VLTLNGFSDFNRCPFAASAPNSKYFMPPPSRVGNKDSSPAAIGYTSSLRVTGVPAVSASAAGVPGMKLCLWTWYWEKSLEYGRKSIRI